MKKLLVVFLLLMSLVACGAKETTTICTSEDYYGMYVTTYKSKGDEVQVISSETSFYVDEMYSNEEIYSEMDNYAASVSGIKGVTYSYTYDEETRLIVETTAVDFRQTKIIDLVNAGFFDSSYKNVDYISLKQSIDLQEKSNGTCSTK